MVKKFLDGAMIGTGVVGVIAVAIVIAWASDVFTVDKDGAVKFAVNDQGKITVGATESYVNLVIQNNAAAANNKVDITADVLTVEGIRLENVNVSADITASGAGGLDTGAEAGSKWYYVWVITNNNGSSVNGLISASSASPTMPPGYTKKRRVGTVRNNASSDFLPFTQDGNRVRIWTGTAILSNGTATVQTAVDVSSEIPPTSRLAILNLDMDILHNASADFAVTIRQNGVVGGLMTNRLQSISGVYVRCKEYGDCVTDNAQKIEYILSVAPIGGGGVTIVVRGYYDRI